jgi:hypothetical protein
MRKHKHGVISLSEQCKVGKMTAVFGSGGHVFRVAGVLSIMSGRSRNNPWLFFGEEAGFC